MKTYEFTVGCLNCWAIRDILNKEIFLGRNIRFMESSHVLVRRFTIQGEEADIDYVKSLLMKWNDSVR